MCYLIWKARCSPKDLRTVNFLATLTGRCSDGTLASVTPGHSSALEVQHYMFATCTCGFTDNKIPTYDHVDHLLNDIVVYLIRKLLAIDIEGR